jgi:hypothetical protein
MCNEKFDTIGILKIDSLTKLLNIVKTQQVVTNGNFAKEKSKLEYLVENKLSELIEQL